MRRKSALNSPDMFIRAKSGQSSFSKFVCCPFVELDTESRKNRHSQMETETLMWILEFLSTGEQRNLMLKCVAVANSASPFRVGLQFSSLLNRVNSLCPPKVRRGQVRNVLQVNKYPVSEFWVSQAVESLTCRPRIALC